MPGEWGVTESRRVRTSGRAPRAAASGSPPPRRAPPRIDMPTRTSSSHPHFDDRGTLDWHLVFEDAQAAAKRESKLLVIEYGREQCSQCRAFVQSTVPRPEIAALLREHFVAVAADCDDAEEEVEELAAKLEGATMLPFLIFADAEGQYLEGLSGGIEAAGFKRVLERLAQR